MQAGTSSDGVVILPRISTLQKTSHMTAKWIRPQMLANARPLRSSKTLFEASSISVHGLLSSLTSTSIVQQHLLELCSALLVEDTGHLCLKA